MLYKLILVAIVACPLITRPHIEKDKAHTPCPLITKENYVLL